MSPNRRIFLNIVATYGRSVFALFCGLFSSRWVLMSLGQEDYGLLGVVGLVVFIGFVNSLFRDAVVRFYAVSVGAANAAADKATALRECRACSFGTFLSAIFVLPLALELPTALKLWPKDPPGSAGASSRCISLTAQPSGTCSPSTRRARSPANRRSSAARSS